MAWDHLAINRPHLVYIILGGFTSLFMLCSSVIKERLYIGEATVATVVGIIFGPHAANLINPLDWGNTDQITLEFSRIVLVVQCFAVGVELPKSYMERHWKSVTLLLLPVMTFGWLVTSLFVWWMFSDRLDWLDSLCIAACVTATDPVLASSVVGKGKFAKRVPKHLRDLLSAESGCNDGMAFPFIYLALNLLKYKLDAKEVTFHWICYTILYECIFGCVYGVLVGYFARRAIRLAHEMDLIDRESFLVFYFVLALFCAGSGSILGVDDLLVGFACGVGFSNDGWFQEKTEESHVSNVIDLLINLAFFVYFGTIVPWEQFNDSVLGITPWRLVVVGVFVLFFRRIPIMMVLKPVIPDIKTWREALFAGHFGPIGVGALFVAILARAELEDAGATPLAILPEDNEFIEVIRLIWPITCFLVICSIVVHGSSIAVFTLGKHINTLTLTFSYTTAVEDGPTWMDRLPRIQSRSKSSMSLRRPGGSETSLDEKGGDLPAAADLPHDFLRRQKEEDTPLAPRRRRKTRKAKNKWDSGIGPGGPISQSAITPASRLSPRSDRDRSDAHLVAVSPNDSPSPEGSSSRSPVGEPQEEIYQEGDHTVIEDEEGNVLKVVRPPEGATEDERARAERREAKRAAKEKDVQHGAAQSPNVEEGKDEPPKQLSRYSSAVDVERGAGQQEQPSWLKRMGGLGHRRPSEAGPSFGPPSSQTRRGPARAYTFGNTVIVEDEDGEVIKQYQIPNQRPPHERRMSFTDGPTGVKTRAAIQRMGHYFGAGGTATGAAASSAEGSGPGTKPADQSGSDDDHIRFTIGDSGARLRKEEFIEQLQRLDTRSRARVVSDQDAPEGLKRDISRQAGAEDGGGYFTSNHSHEDLDRTVSAAESIPHHHVADALAHFSFERGAETPAQRRRRLADGADPLPSRIAEANESSESETESVEEDDDDLSPAIPEQRPGLLQLGRLASEHGTQSSGGTTPAPLSLQPSYFEEVETEAERRRRQGALGLTQQEDSSDEEENAGPGFRDPRPREQRRPSVTAAASAAQPTSTGSAAAQGGGSIAAATASTPNIRFAEDPRSSASSGPRLRWGADVGKKP
jgi:NhaP-type Na+/H+ or K+/H+ antiporter